MSKLKPGQHNSIFTEGRKGKTMHAYLTLEEKVRLVQECDTTCLYVMDFYLSKVGAQGYEYTDEKTATALQLTERTVQRCRQLLTKNGWFYQEKFRTSNGKNGINTYLGKTAVSNALLADLIANTNTNIPRITRMVP